ncbi:MAG TPA: type II secretion system inner membrane protein GspF [Candidatus Hydrogenedentes bacterium]|nr:type II secretion system inner membrane protein GspF [Candidatus Hydrogenedentota bacterium]HOL77951.1 type II secretion system inner membrane protein GspF [Candidatus Hydrogenedentota bacterium]HPO85261.1 type II secretion system inner membrane protein GspF [Candidatus Hydrogenedentota bacterium]
MAKFAYKAVNAKDGKTTFGVVEAETLALAINDVRSLGLHPTMIRPATKSDERRARKKLHGGKSELYFGGVSTKQLVVMTRQLATLIDAGLPLLRSLNVLISQLKACKLKDILREISADIQSGATFAEALAKHPRYFDRLFVNMVRAGEVGGMLEVVLNRLAVFMERRQALKRKVRSAMIYPIFVVIVSTAIVLFLLTYIIPQFAEIFKDFGAKLPWMTLFLIDAGDFVRFKWWILSLWVNGILITLKILLKIPIVKSGFDRVILKVPLVGDLVTKVAVARFSRTLGTLITSGVPILQSLRITKETIGNEVIENAIQKVHDSIKEGDTIAAPLDEAKVFPAMVVNMIDVGEETGSLDAMLMKVADIYDAEVEAAVEAMLRLLEPALIVILGGIIGFIVIALYLPIFSLADAMSGA